jgi:hypothetical protein
MLIIMSLVKVTSEWSYTSPHLLCLYGVEQENFSFLTIICEYFQCCLYAVNTLLCALCVCVCVCIHAHICVCAHACTCVCVQVRVFFNLNKFIQHAPLHGNTICFRVKYSQYCYIYLPLMYNFFSIL